MSKRTTVQQAISGCKDAEIAASRALAAVRDALPIGAHVRVEGLWEGSIEKYAHEGSPYVFVVPLDGEDVPRHAAHQENGSVFVRLEDIDVVSISRPARKCKSPARIARPRIAAMQGELLDATTRQLRLGDGRQM
jgi:hypothetical protein